MLQVNKIAPILVGVALAALSLAFSLTSSVQKNLTIDESVHLAAGYSYLTEQAYDYNPEHPPVIKALSALPLLFLDLKPMPEHEGWEDMNQYEIGKNFIYHNSTSFNLIIFWGRLANHLLLAILVFVVFWWSQKKWGWAAGLGAGLLTAFLPELLAHGRLVTTDLGLALGFLLTIIAFDYFIRQPGWWRFWPLVLAFGFVQLSKFSAVFLWAILLLLTTIYYLRLPKQRGQRGWWPRFIYLCQHYLFWIFLLLLTTWGLAFLVYGLEISSVAQDPVSYGKILSHFNLNANDWQAAWLQIPIPAYSYFKGFVLVATHNTYGHDSFLLGMYSKFGWPYYFLVSFLIKTPLSLLILLLVTFITWVKQTNGRVKRLRRPWLRKALAALKRVPFQDWLLIIPPVIFYVAALSSKINLGNRHILLVYPFIIIFVSRLADYRGKLAKVIKVFFWLMVAWLMAASLWIYPHYLSYFNEAIGGPEQGYHYLVDSNIDWGQDVIMLKRYMDENNIEEIGFAYFGQTPPEEYGINRAYIPDQEAIDDGYEPSGIYAVSVTVLNEEEARFAWLKDYQPTGRAGYSILIYDLRP